MPPAGVFRFTLWLEGVYEQEEPSFERPERFTWIRRSEGRLVDNGRLYVALENAHYRRTSELSSPPGKEAPTFALENDQFRTLQMAWDDAWYVRRRQLRANGVNPLDLPSSAPMARRNRQETIEKYHFEGWGPADLPDWFWDMEECPPFEPPNGITRFEYTDPGPNPLTGERGTWISQSATWGWLMGQTLHFEPGNARVEWDLGSYPRGTVPMRWEHVNRVYEAAKHEWGEEWRRRSRRRRGD
jgi:hypothetical protein